MQRETRRRAFLGGLAVAGVGTAGYLLRPRERPQPRWLQPVDPLSATAPFAHVGGRAEGSIMHVEIAMRQPADHRREIVLFADSDDPVTAAIPGLRSFWRLNVSTVGRSVGTARLEVGEHALDVELHEEIPERFREPRLELTPRGLWRATHVAYVRGYSTGPDSGRVEVVARKPFGRGDPPLDSIVFRTPRGETVGSAEPPTGETKVAFAVEPFERFEADGRLVGLREGQRVDDVDLFYH